MGESPAVAACSLTKVICARFELAVATTVFAGGDEERYFAPMNDAQGGGPAGDQSSRDGGVVLKRKVPGKIVPRVGSSRWFPGEFLKTLDLAGGEDYGYFASGAGDAGSNPAAGIMPA